MTKLSMKARKEVIAKFSREYQRVGKKGKGEILDHVCATAGLSRDRAARLLRQPPKKYDARGRPKKEKGKENRGRKPKYHEKVVQQLLERLWEEMDYACGKRLVEGLPAFVEALQRFGELDAPDWAAEKVLAMSASTMDRLLTKARKSVTIKGRSTTKPGSMRKADIPIRRGTDWDDAVVGFMEMDLVAHCGEATVGDYVNTLDMTDIPSGWTEPIAVLNKARRHVHGGVKTVQARLPFTLRGMDSDNGGEFINDLMMAYCKAENILFTRGRPYNKNDNCHIEQKNFTHVRKTVGYGRFEGQRAVDLLNAYYDRYRLFANFFLPSAKLREKYRQTTPGLHFGRVTKRYDKPQTPYQRLLLSPDVTPEQKAALQTHFLTQNPAALKRDMISLLQLIEAEALPNARPQ